MSDLIDRQAAIDALCHVDIPTGVAIVVHEDGTVSRITGIKI